MSDLLFAVFEPEKSKIISTLFVKIFRITPVCVRAFLCGIISGFPLGVKVAAELYEKDIISKSECERLICFSNNTGPGFVIFAVGQAMRKSLLDGVILYISMLLSAVCIGIALGFGKPIKNSFSNLKSNNYSLVSSIKNAGLNTLNICSFITFFGIICGFLKSVLPKSIYIFLIPFLEIGNAVKEIGTQSLPSLTSLLISSFAVSFSGISVLLQAKSFLKAEISMKKYTLAKIMQGCLSVIFTYLLVLLYKAFT
jgi:hypothetical protein